MIDELEKKLEVLPSPLLVLDRSKRTVQLRQSPDKVAAQIRRGLGRVAAVRAEQEAAAPEPEHEADSPAAADASTPQDGDGAPA
jgi:hypothetical protein